MISVVTVSILPFFILFAIPLGATPASSQRILKVLLAFSVGGLLGDVFLHILPHLQSNDHDHGHSHGHAHDHHGHGHGHDHGHHHDNSQGLLILGGIVGFFIVDKLVRNITQMGDSGHGHSHSEGHGHSHSAATTTTKYKEIEGSKSETKADSTKKDSTESGIKPSLAIQPVAWLNLVADFTHNFTDGLAIGSSFVAGPKVGMTTTVAILLHELPHEIGDFAILVQSGMSRRSAMGLQLVTALGAVLGTIIGVLVEGSETKGSTQWILPLTAGGFIYVAATGVLPELLSDCRLSQTLMELTAMGVGVALMVLITQLE